MKNLKGNLFTYNCDENKLNVYMLQQIWNGGINKIIM